MTRTLLKKQFREIFRSFFFDPKRNAMRSGGQIAARIVLYAVLMGFLLVNIGVTLSVALLGLAFGGMDWLYFLIIGLVSVLFGAMGSVFSTASSLYLAKDNDLLLSLPIPVGSIIVSRIAGVYLMGLVYSGIIFLPSVFAYCIGVRFSISVVLTWLLWAAGISLLVLDISCLLGFVVAKLMVRLKNRSVLTVIIAVVLIGLYYFLSFNARNVISGLVADGEKVGERISFLRFFGAAPTGDWAACAVFVLAVAAISGLVWLLLRKTFIKIVTLSPGAKKNLRGAADTGRTRTVSGALLVREIRKFTSSAGYMLNCGMGIILMLIGGVAVIITGRDIAAALGPLVSTGMTSLTVMLACAVSLLASMVDITAPSVALEGKTVWILQSLPVPASKVLSAKLACHGLFAGAPALFCSACAAFSVPGLDAADIVSIFVLPLSAVALISTLGLFLGLVNPNLKWTSEIYPIKQSMPVTVCVIAGMLYPVVIMGVFSAFRLLVPAFPAPLYIGIFAAVNFGLSFMFYRLVMTKGARTFSGL
ncbi:MAG: hypothetical protein IJU57_07010 [Clostridia bacterium]|nr:hypothetical protein [Clostridia bacterium]